MSQAITATNTAVAASINESQAAALFETLVVNGDLSAMSQEQRIQYYKLVCERVGLDPYQKPFDLIKLSGKLTLYANKTCTAQLTSIRGLRVAIVAREVIGDQYVVTARCETPTGSYSEDIGAVTIGGMRGDAASNAMKKAATQAKRRAILSACGLGMLDEEEVVQVQGAERIELPPIKPATTSEQDEAITEWLSAIDAATGPEELTAIVMEMKTLDDSIKSAIRDYVAQRAKELGLVWKAGLYHEVQR
jgi:hypothetical protein